MLYHQINQSHKPEIIFRNWNFLFLLFFRCIVCIIIILSFPNRIIFKHLFCFFFIFFIVCDWMFRYITCIDSKYSIFYIRVLSLFIQMVGIYLLFSFFFRYMFFIINVFIQYIMIPIPLTSTWIFKPRIFISTQ